MRVVYLIPLVLFVALGLLVAFLSSGVNGAVEVEEKETCQVHVKLGDGAEVLALPEGCASGPSRGTITAGPDGVDCAGVDQIDVIEDEDTKKLISKMCSDDDADVASGRPGCIKQMCWCMDSSVFYKCKESEYCNGGTCSQEPPPGGAGRRERPARPARPEGWGTTEEGDAGVQVEGGTFVTGAGSSAGVSVSVSASAQTTS
jgi:hypothetical protein